MSTQAMDRERLDELIREFDTAMLVTQTGDGQLRARPMAIADVDAAGHVWFVTDEHSAKVAEIDDHATINVTLQGPQRFASLSAVARPERDTDRIRALWREPWRVWFPDGPETEGLILLHAEPTVGEYWDNRGTRGLSFLWQAAKAYARGERLDPDDVGDQQHGRTDL